MLWSPSRKESSRLFSYMKKKGMRNYRELHSYSIEHFEEFWRDIFIEFDIVFEGGLEKVCPHRGFDSYEWFPNVKMNFAENLLRYSRSDDIALNFFHESKFKRKLSYKDLYNEVSSLSCFLDDFLSEGDVLACYMPHIPETVVSMLATTALGGVFTSTSVDFGEGGVLDRFFSVSPKVLVAASGYDYKGRYFDQIPRIEYLMKKLPSLKKVIIVDFLNKRPSLPPQAISWEKACERKKEINFRRVSFQTPVYIMYSSGTTGTPKSIVHTVGGVLLQHVKELGFHCDLMPKEKIFYMTNCGWMMWNWLISSLFFKGEVVLYEGAPGYPSMKDFISWIHEEKINILGTSPRFLKIWERDVKEKMDFPHLRLILSTGSPLMPEQFDFVYTKVKKDVQLSSISGGTDILGCFMLGNPLLPVHRGRIQCLGLGMDVACFDENGNEVFDEEGELVCRQTFPSRPLCFLNDPSFDLIKKAYFNRFEGIWHHGDFVEIKKDGTVIVYGRSDATLNPAGVRMGTGEIYRQVEKIEWIEDSLCVGRKKEGEEEVVLFVKLKEGDLTLKRQDEIKNAIKENLSARHVPRCIFYVKDIPYTRSGKKMELLVSRLLEGRVVKNKEAVANPECLEEYGKMVT